LRNDFARARSSGISAISNWRRAFVAPDHALISDQVDDARTRFRADREFAIRSEPAEPVFDFGVAAAEIGADPVHLVDEADARHTVICSLTPYRLGLRLDPGNRVEHGDSASRTRRLRSTSIVKSTCRGCR